MIPDNIRLDAMDRRLIDNYQKGLPVSERPFLDVARDIGTTEADVLERLDRLQVMGVLGRVGPVFDHARAGASMLAAVSVPDEETETVARLINAAPGVNHNYAREHAFNLWFVMTAPDEDSLESRMDQLEADLARPILRLPMLHGFHIDLSFPIPWAELEGL